MRYFDYNATTPLNPVGYSAWKEAQDNAWQNPSSASLAGARVHALLEKERESLAKILGCSDAHIVFTSGATEANNTIFYYLREQGHLQVVISNMEHPSVKEAACELLGEGVLSLPVDQNGAVRLDVLEGFLKEGGVRLVSVMAASNETGILQPWEKVRELCVRYQAWLHVDVSQWVGKMPGEGLGACDFLTGCAHKFGGPKGVGFLKIPEDVRGFHFLKGGGQEHGHRSGTEDYPAIASMMDVLRLRTESMDTLGERSTWRDAFEKAIKVAIPGVYVLGERGLRLWNTSALLMPQYFNNMWAMRLEKYGFCVGMGAACSTIKRGHSSIYKDMGLSEDAGAYVLRVSSGWETTQEDWEFLADAFKQVWDDLQKEEAGSQVIAL